MAEFLKKTVMPSGGDYTSLEACMNANEQDLTDDGWFTVEIDGDWSGGADTTAVTIHNYPNTASDYINIYTTAAARHDGTATGNSDAYIHKITSAAHNISVQSSYVTLTGLIIEHDCSGDYKYGINITASNVTVDKCVVFSDTANWGTYGNAGVTADNVGSVYVRNSVIYGFVSYPDNTAGIGLFSINASGSLTSQNNTIYNCEVGTNIYLGSMACTNTVAYNCTDGDFNASTTGNYNFSKDDSAPGDNSIHGDTDGETPNFVSTTSGSEDFHLASTLSGLYDAGTDLSGTFTDDIDGDTRSVWSIGVDDAPAVSFTNGQIYATVAPVSAVIQSPTAFHVGDWEYSKENVANLGADDAVLAATYSWTDFTNVASDDSVVVDLLGNNYLVHQFKNKSISNTRSISVNWDGKTTLAPSDSPVVLQIYNRIATEWESLDTESGVGAGTEFTLTGSKTSDVGNYYDANNLVSCRVYQQVV